MLIEREVGYAAGDHGERAHAKSRSPSAGSRRPPPMPTIQAGNRAAVASEPARMGQHTVDPFTAVYGAANVAAERSG